MRVSINKEEYVASISKIPLEIFEHGKIIVNHLFSAFSKFWNTISLFLFNKQSPASTSSPKSIPGPSVAVSPTTNPAQAELIKIGRDFGWIDPQSWVMNKFLNPEKSNIPNELRNVLLRDMQVEEYCENIKIISTDYFFASSTDLNADGVKEFFIYPGHVCGIQIPGASGIGSIYIYQKINGFWKKIGHFYGGMFAIDEEKTNGFKNITSYKKIDISSGDTEFYQWNKAKSEYELIKTEKAEPDD